MDKIKVLYVEKGKEPKAIDIDNSLEALQNIVGGYIEAVYFSDCILLCKEERINKNLPFNTEICNDDRKPVGVIRGSFVLVGQNGSEFDSLSDELIELYTEKFSL